MHRLSVKLSFAFLLSLCFVLQQLEAQNSGDWTIKVGGRPVVVIGDIHGDLNALQRILENEGLIDSKGKWTGGDTVLMFMGDLVDRGPDSLGVMDLVMSLEKQAQQTGGHVEALLGNHEALVTASNTRYISPEEHESFRAMTGEPIESAWAKIYTGDSKYSRWIRSRRTMVRLEMEDGKHYALVHAGLGRWASRLSPNEINKLVQDWISFYQGEGSEPDFNTEWVMDNVGPLWIRDMALPKESSWEPLTRQELRQLLSSLNVSFLISGHTTTDYLNRKFQVVKQTEQYWRDYILVDTGISEIYGGNLSSLRLENGKRKVRYHQRPTELLPITKEFRDRCNRSLINMSMDWFEVDGDSIQN